MKKFLSFFAAFLFAASVMADPITVILPDTLDVTNVSFRSEGMPDFVLADGDYAGTYFDMGAHDSSNDTLLYAEWNVTIEPIKYNLAVNVYNTNSWRVQLYLLNQAGDTVKDLRYKGSSGQCGQYPIGTLDLSDLTAGDYKVRARAATAWSAMKLKNVIFAADYQGVSVELPGTLLPAYAELSEGASVANDAIAFAPATANTEYAIWNVSFEDAGDYNVSIDMTASNGHTYGVALLSADGASEIDAVDEEQAWDTGVKELGAITVPAAGDYKVKLTNATKWSEAVLNSITISAPEEVKYYAKNNWDGGEWTWLEMTKEEDEYQLRGVFGGTGVNVNDKEDDANTLWFPLYMITALATDSTPAELAALDTALFVFNPADSTMTAYIVGKYVEPEPQVGGIVYNWAKEAADQIGTTTLGGNSNISIGTVKIHSNTDQVDGVKFGSSYVYAEGKYVSIRPAEGAFKAGDTIKTSVVFNNSDATKYCMVDIYAADTQTRLFRSDSASTLNGQNAGDPAIQEYILASDQDSLLLGRYGSTSMFITLLQVVRPGVAPEPEHTYTIAGSSAAVFGTTWDAANTANDMVKQEDGTYKFEKTEVTLAAGKIEFKLVEDHTKWAPDPNMELDIPAPGVYTITITFDPNAASAAEQVTADATKTADAEVLPMIVLHGNFTGSWADTEEFVVAEDKLTASLALTLTAGTYEFGMKFDGNWKANGAQLTREAPQTSLLEGNGNMKVTADVAGEYVFTYTFLGEQLVVTYPAQAEGIEDIDAALKAVKYIENGQVVIERNGKVYTVTGMLIR